jgi:hypothetical protein
MKLLVHQSPHLSKKVQNWQMVCDAGFEPATCRRGDLFAEGQLTLKFNVIAMSLKC